ncbi:hypothetical protein QBC46DRAFT_13646 [Diplogelasinospora grovesii]|uniref:Uncharacterized protein n=1 Tax=Diplogelasinospora grovesii TaxID=303347 RepID=A0AAN6NDS2_9PEZI|nr:hypothetical protein QBC46DRAFT_13646 [Diplogelasinospora grovesii]
MESRLPRKAYKGASPRHFTTPTFSPFLISSSHPTSSISIRPIQTRASRLLIGQHHHQRHSSGALMEHTEHQSPDPQAFVGPPFCWTCRPDVLDPPSVIYLPSELPPSARHRFAPGRRGTRPGLGGQPIRAARPTADFSALVRLPPHWIRGLLELFAPGLGVYREAFRRQRLARDSAAAIDESEYEEDEEDYAVSDSETYYDTDSETDSVDMSLPEPVPATSRKDAPRAESPPPPPSPDSPDPPDSPPTPPTPISLPAHSIVFGPNDMAFIGPPTRPPPQQFVADSWEDSDTENDDAVDSVPHPRSWAPFRDPMQIRRCRAAAFFSLYGVDRLLQCVEARCLCRCHREGITDYDENLFRAGPAPGTPETGGGAEYVAAAELVSSFTTQRYSLDEWVAGDMLDLVYWGRTVGQEWPRGRAPPPYPAYLQ